MTIEPHFVRNGCRGSAKFAILLQFLTIEPHCASSALPKREKKKKERDRDRGQEGKRERERKCEDVKM
jgi:hypothetical protein